MNNKDLAKKVRVLRSRKGYSQEVLSEKTGLSLRTIQRIENGETEPRGDSLKRLAIVFEVSPDEIVDWVIQEDKGFLVALNLSALAFLVSPILGILIPLIIWISKKDKIRNLNEIAKDLLNFQITWTIFFFAGYMFIMINMLWNIFHTLTSGWSFSALFSTLIFVGIMYLSNLTLIVLNTIRINNGKMVNYFLKIRFLKK
jgi:uncharacterized Tic20 family protein